MSPRFPAHVAQSLHATFIPIERRARSRLPLSSLGTPSRYDSGVGDRGGRLVYPGELCCRVRENVHMQGLSRAIQGDGSLSAAARSRPRHDAKSTSEDSRCPARARARAHAHTHTLTLSLSHTHTKARARCRCSARATARTTPRLNRGATATRSWAHKVTRLCRRITLAARLHAWKRIFHLSHKSQCIR